MENKNDGEKMEEVMLPGFRFHPTDEELVGFYLKRKIQQRPLSMELIKQLDIYKYDPWDLPSMATTGEKEWYFYCPRDRKYRNSARPNRVTCAGFWKATGTDRPIYSSEGSRCIGLKKSLVFYKGRAAKGTKTDWMMHEFRLPSLTNSAAPPKPFMDTVIPANESWAICRIFKKTNSTAQRTLSHSFVSPTYFQAQLPTLPSVSDTNNTVFFQEDYTSLPKNISSYLHFKPTPNFEKASFVFSPLDTASAATVVNHVSSGMLRDYDGSRSCIDFSGGLISVVDRGCNSHLTNVEENQWDQTIRSMGFPFTSADDGSEMATGFSVQSSVL